MSTRHGIKSISIFKYSCLVSDFTKCLSQHEDVLEGTGALLALRFPGSLHGWVGFGNRDRNSEGTEQTAAEDH